MTAFKMPNDNVIVDAKGKALPHILPAFRVLERLSRLSSKQIDALIGVVDDEANLLGASGGGEKGDIMYRGDQGWQNLSVGEDNTILQAVSGIPAWVPPSESVREWEIVAEVDVTGAGQSVIFSGLNKHAMLRFEFLALAPEPVGAPTFMARLSPDGVTYSTANYVNKYHDNVALAATAFIDLSPGASGNPGAFFGMWGDMTLRNPSSASYLLASSNLVGLDTTTMTSRSAFHTWLGSPAPFSIRFQWQSGSWVFGSGKIRMWRRTF